MIQCKRIMLKLSGEALSGENGGFGIDPPAIDRFAEELAEISRSGPQLCVTVGGGNIFRGVLGDKLGVDRSTADYMGMLATVINALALQSAMEAKGVFTRVVSALPMASVCEPYILRRTLRHLEKNRVIIFAAGTGNPYSSTDSAAALRAAEMGCDVIVKATNVDGVYTEDPHGKPDAERFGRLSYHDVLARNLRVMDSSAITLARDNNIPIIVFSLWEPGSFMRVIKGEGRYTIIDNKAGGPEIAPAGHSERVQVGERKLGDVIRFPPPKDHDGGL